MRGSDIIVRNTKNGTVILSWKWGNL